MNNNIFMCFAAEDRYRIVESLVYHLKNYGIGVWYDRYSLVLGDDRVKKNLLEGAANCKYATVVISEYTMDSICAMEELSIIKARYQRGELTVFPVLYEISPNSLSQELCWIKELIFKETNKQSGTYEICNHIACKVTNDILEACPNCFQTIYSLYVFITRYSQTDSSVGILFFKKTGDAFPHFYLFRQDTYLQLSTPTSKGPIYFLHLQPFP